MEVVVSGEELAPGWIVAVKTKQGDEFEGQIVAYDRPSSMLVVQERRECEDGYSGTLRLVNTNQIKDYTLLERRGDPLDLTKCYVDFDAMKAREESALRLPSIYVAAMTKTCRVEGQLSQEKL